jgi:hypothetical protein
MPTVGPLIDFLPENKRLRALYLPDLPGSGNQEQLQVADEGDSAGRSRLRCGRARRMRCLNSEAGNADETAGAGGTASVA